MSMRKPHKRFIMSIFHERNRKSVEGNDKTREGGDVERVEK